MRPEASSPRSGPDAPRTFDRERGWHVVAQLAVVVGIALRLFQFAARPSIWVDEAALVRSILDRTPLALLTTPLDYGQVAPAGFLLLVKLCATLFGIEEFSLRLPPLIAGLLSVPLFRHLAQRLLSAPAAAVATALFALALPLIQFSANVKPYTADVLVVVGIALLTCTALERPADRRTDVPLACSGLLACLFSTTAAFILAPAAILLMGAAWHGAVADRRRRFVVAAIWAGAVVAALAWNVWLESPTDRRYLQLFWSSGFVPAGIRPFVPWLFGVLLDVFGGGGWMLTGTFKYASPTGFAVLVALGTVSAAVRGWTERLLLLGPVALALVAAAIGVFPFSGRLIMFLTPIWLLFAVRGAEVAGRLVLPRRYGALVPLLLVPVAVQTLLANPLPQRPEEMRPVLAYVQAHRQPGDAVWVYYGAAQAFAYYARILGLAATAISECDRGNTAGQLAQVDVLRGRARAWVIVSHGYAIGTTNERALLVRYLDRIGERLETFPADFAEDADRASSAALLYRLDDPSRLAAASAATFPVPAAGGAAWSCYGTMSHDPRGGERAAAAVGR